LMMMHSGSALTTCSHHTLVQLCLSEAKIFAPPPSVISALGMARPGPVRVPRYRCRSRTR
jgi:hypothetical protein